MFTTHRHALLRIGIGSAMLSLFLAEGRYAVCPTKLIINSDIANMFFSISAQYAINLFFVDFRQLLQRRLYFLNRWQSTLYFIRYEFGKVILRYSEREIIGLQ